MAGEYTAPPAQGPIITLICGITPDDNILSLNTSAYPPNDETPS